MKQAQFERQGRPRWDAFEKALEGLGAGERDAVREFPHLYRRLCQDLALARDRHFSGGVRERLNRLALAGHHRLYGTRRGAWSSLRELVAREFPRAVRGEWRLVVFVTLIFYGGALAVAASILAAPELSQSYLDATTLANIEEMYDPSNPSPGLMRDAGSDVQMFGFYVMNNVSIAFRTFASGLLFGVGTLFIVGLNALYMGAIFGHLTQIGSGTPLYTFVIAHGSFELTAILLAGVAGMRLGLGLVAPGNASRLQALRDSAQRALPLVYGVGFMLLVAAGIEAFWSPRGFAPEVKYTVGGALWLLVFAYLLLAGRPRRVDS